MIKAALFDLDGVIIDTEGQYFQFWGVIVPKFLPQYPDFGNMVKGCTLVDIHQRYFDNDPAKYAEVDRLLNEFEANMKYELFPGALELVDELRSQGILCAIVTSSNQEKMASLAQQLPTLSEHFDHIFTAEDAGGAGKPAPDCYLNAARYFNVQPSECLVFEDSINGLKSGRAAGARVIGVTTTNNAEIVTPLADLVYPSLHECSADRLLG